MGYKNAELLTYKTDFREPPAFNDKQLLQQITLEVVEQGGSDLYFQSGEPVLVKVHGVLKRLTERKMTAQECLQIVSWIAGSEQAASRIAEGKESRSSYNSVHPTKRDPKTGEKVRYRFRSNAIGGEYRGGQGVQVVMRAIRSESPMISELDIDPAIVEASTPESGVVYITGATGSGKSTTFAAMVRRILEEDTPIQGNIMTIESPIEYLLSEIDSQHSVVFQTEVERGVQSFAEGVVSAMRHDPSMIVVGETRDEATASAVFAASQTGHLVYTTLHANGVGSVPGRMLSFFDPSVHHSLLFSVIDSARMIINQRLVPSLDGKRVALREYLVMTQEIRDRIIRASDPARIAGVMREHLIASGVPMSRAAEIAYERGLISDAVLKINRES